ncbi:MAG: protease [Mycobacteriales bacterium]
MSVQGKSVAFVTSAAGIEQAELTGPWQAVEQAGGRPVLVATTDGKVQAFNHLDPAHTFPVDRPVSAADPREYAAVVLPGGVANGDALRVDEDAQRFVKAFFDAGKPVAVICHAPWILTEIGVLDGRTLTSWPTLRTDLRNAGATWVDQEVVVDTTGAGPLISSRKPDDIPAFSRELLAAL